jgi:anti-sigma factor RsiW
MRNDCEHLEPALHDWLEGWLAEPERAIVEAHLRACPACCAKLEAWQAVGRALRELPRLPAPAACSPEPAREPRGALRLALALCVPTALLTVAFRASFSPPPLESWLPRAAVQTLTRPFTAPAETLWNRLQEVISSWTVS